MYNKITGDDVCYFLGYWLYDTVGYKPTFYDVDINELLNTEEFIYKKGVAGNSLGKFILTLTNIDDSDYDLLLEYSGVIYSIFTSWIDTNLSTFTESIRSAYNDSEILICYLDHNNIEGFYTISPDMLSYYSTLVCTTERKLVWKSENVKYFIMNIFLDILMNSFGFEAVQLIIMTYFKVDIVHPAKTYPTFHMLIGIFNSLTEEEFENLMTNYGFGNFDFQETKMLIELGLFDINYK